MCTHPHGHGHSHAHTRSCGSPKQSVRFELWLRQICATSMRSLLLGWRCGSLVDPWLSTCKATVLILILQNKGNKTKQHYHHFSLSNMYNKCTHTLLPKISQEKKPTKFYQVYITNVIFVWFTNKNISTQLLYKSNTFISRKDTFIICKPFWKPWWFCLDTSGIFYHGVIIYGNVLSNILVLGIHVL